MEEVIILGSDDLGAYLLSMLIAFFVMAFIINGLYDIVQANPQMFQSSGNSNSGNTFFLLWLALKLLP